MVRPDRYLFLKLLYLTLIWSAYLYSGTTLSASRQILFFVLCCRISYGLFISCNLNSPETVPWRQMTTRWCVMVHPMKADLPKAFQEPSFSMPNRYYCIYSFHTSCLRAGLMEFWRCQLYTFVLLHVGLTWPQVILLYSGELLSHCIEMAYINAYVTSYSISPWGSSASISSNRVPNQWLESLDVFRSIFDPETLPCWA